MTNVTSWTETEISILVQVWSEVEAKYPLLRCPRGAGTLHSRLYAMFSKRCAFPRSSTAVNRVKHTIRKFVLFVHKFNEDRREDGECLWYDLSVAERRALMPPKLRGLSTTVNQKAFARLMTMERAHRWLGEENASMNDALQDEEQELQSLAAAPSNDRVSSVDELYLSSEPSTPSTEQSGDKIVESRFVATSRRSPSSSRSPSFDNERELSSSPLPRTTKFQGNDHKPKAELQLPTKLKHRDCNILLENMMKLQDKKMRRGVAKLRSDIEGEIQRSSEMLHSIISNQFEDPGSSGDVAFMLKVLNMQHQQIRERFEQFDEKQTRDEAENRALIG